jgi:hypothetical protein
LNLEILKTPLDWLSKSFLSLLSAPGALLAGGIAFAIGAALIAMWGLELDKLKKIAGEKGEEAGAQRQTQEILDAIDPTSDSRAIMDAVEGKETAYDIIAKETKKVQETRAALYQPLGFKPTSVDKNGVWQFENDKGMAPIPEVRDKIDAEAVNLVNQGKELSYTGAQKPLMTGVKASTAGGGRGVDALEDYLQRQEIERVGTGAAFGVRPKGIKSLPPTPSKVSDLSNELQNLSMAEFDTMGNSTGMPVVVNQQTSTGIKDKPIPTTPKVRDDTNILQRSFRGSTVRAY